MAKPAQLMAVLNMTPDSLYGSVLKRPKNNLEKQIVNMLGDGADIIDVGGESTAPGSHDISEQEEWARIEPALKILQQLKRAGKFDFQISVDTYKSQVLKRALEFEIDMLNDVTALRGDESTAELVAKSGIDVCLLHAAVALSASGNEERTNNEAVAYKDVIKAVGDFWQIRIDYATKQGIKSAKIILDPGMGAFVSGDPKYSFEILQRLGELKQRFKDFRLLVGASRKGFLDMSPRSNTRLPVSERLEPGLAAAAIAAYNGADIIRTHDVAATRKVLDFVANFAR